MSVNVNVQLWVKAIEENLYEKALDKIALGATDDNQYLSAKTIIIPQAGTASTIEKNPSRPLTVGTRTDTIQKYDLDEWVIKPRLLPFSDQNQVNYDKMKSFVNDVMGGLPVRLMKEFTHNWYPTNTNKVDTTGSNYTAHATGATGNRKGLVMANLMSAAEKLNRMDVPEQDRVAWIDWTMLHQLLNELGVQSGRDAALNFDQNGLNIPLLAGFKIIPMNYVAYTTASGSTLRAVGNAGATTDSAVALCGQRSMFSYAMGNIEIFNNMKDAIYAGDVISGAVWGGGKYRRLDKVGVIPIIQATP